MIDVVGITFKENGKIYYFSPNKFNLKKNVTVIVETERGLQFGKVEEDVKQISSNIIKGEIRNVVRIATKNDFQKHLKNIRESKDALKKCKELVQNQNLNMQLLDATYTFDKTQLMFRFIADNRVDFRALAKELASIYKTRIELRQVGARDKAKEISGYGVCGRKLCCSKFLNDLDSVSISMAKNQNLSLNPSKINGVCGRLLCCLNYEDDCYTECKSGLPRIGSFINTKEGKGKVISVNILKGICRVDVQDKGITEVNFNENN